MKNLLICSIVGLFLLSVSTVVQAEQPQADKPKFSASVSLGTSGGIGGEINAMVSNVASGFPMNIRGGVGYSSTEPGISADARRIFINDATNGVPEESGRIWGFKLDLMYPVRLLSIERAYLYGGPRYTEFVANFKYIGGNEDFDVRSSQWGFGSGLEAYFPINNRIDLSFTTGLDYLAEANLQGHDTMYSPDGTTGNERNDYTYDDADAAINQPKFEIRAMLGLQYNF